MFNVKLVMKDLEKYLKTNHITCTEFAKKAEVNLSTFSRIKSGDYHPGTKILTKIINTMGKDINYYTAGIDGVEGIVAVAETLSVDELITVVAYLQQVKDRKIKEKLDSLENERNMYVQILQGESQ